MEIDQLPNGVRLTRNSLGGHTVEWNGTCIGWMHASIGDRWNAYVGGAKPGAPGTHLGRFTRTEAVRQIAMAAGWQEAE